MIIGGINKLTLIDYPGELAAIVFTKGCNFRCHHCYNPLLVVPEYTGTHINKSHPQINSEGDFLGFLKTRLGKINAVVVSGGEPTIHKDLPIFIKKIKDLGLKVKLDTNGTNPIMLSSLIKNNLINYVAMDIKAPLNDYKKIINTEVDLIQIQKSIKILLDTSIDYEFRSTLLPKQHSLDDIHNMGMLINGAKLWYIQNFKSNTDLVDLSFNEERSFNEIELKEIVAVGTKYVQNCKLR